MTRKIIFKNKKFGKNTIKADGIDPVVKKIGRIFNDIGIRPEEFNGIYGVNIVEPDLHPAENPIEHQDHYEQYAIQPIVFIGANNLDFFQGNIIKYVCRFRKKGGVEDLKKARHYLDMYIQKESGQEIKP